MKSVASFITGALVTAGLLSAVALFAQDNPLSLGRPFVIDISQAVPVVADVALDTDDGVITATLPLTVDVALKIAISGPLSVTVTGETSPLIAVEQPVVGEEQTDDLGLAYTIAIDSPDLTVTEWTAFANPQGWLEFAGEVAISEDAKAFEKINCTVRLYKAGKLVKVAEIANVGFMLQPGDTSRFSDVPLVQPEDVDSYTVEFEVIR